MYVYKKSEKMYNEMKKIGIVFLVSLLITALLVPMPTSAQAEKPEWEEGDAWAMGAEGDLQEIFAPAFDMIDEEFDPEDEEDLDEIDYDFEGEVGFYQIYEVVEANDDGYVMEIEAGGGIQASGSFEATGDMPKEGEYDMDEDPDTEEGTMSVEGELFFMLDVQGTVHFDADLAIEEIEIEYSLEFSAEFSAENVPDHDYDWEEGTVTITHEDYSGGVSVEASLNLQMEFDPALDMFQFPFDEGDSWTAESMMTGSGSYEGVMDVDYEDMPEEFQEEMEDFQDEVDQEFPIKLEEIDTEEEEMNFGEIKETTEEITVPMKCTGTDEVVLHDGSTTEVYALEFGIDDDFMMAQQGPAFQMMYSPDAGFIVSQQVDLGPEMGEMIGQFIDMEAMQMESMDVEDARESKEEAQEEDDDDDDTPGFTLALLTLGAVVAVVVYYKKER